MRQMWSELLWGKHAKLWYLLLAASILLFSCLGSREIWTQEHRWADIVSAMFYYHDFLHPSLNGSDYYDKPLLSYWLIIGFSYLMGFTTWALRFPSALAGLLAVWSIYNLGKNLKNQQLGLLAGWMLLTTYYFIFWTRTSNADMLNLAGMLFSIAWYFAHKNTTRWIDYVVFFLIMAITALCKGLVGPIVACLAILPDLMMQQEWKKHLRFSVIIALIPAAIVYLLPFWASTHFSHAQYGENGLMLVYKENVLRYFQPFDHKGPIYTYFIYLPVFLLPWTLFFIPALFTIKSRWKTMSSNSKWMVWSLLLTFIFFTVSGSRRYYYVLPIVPFAILMTADWILDSAKTLVWSGRMAATFFVMFFITFDIGQALYYAGGGLNHFAKNLQHEVAPIKPWSQWNFVMLDPESKVRFHLNLPPDVKNYNLGSKSRANQTSENLLTAWPFLKEANHHVNTIYVSRKQYEEPLKAILKNYEVVEEPIAWGQRLVKNQENLAIAFVPKNYLQHSKENL